MTDPSPGLRNRFICLQPTIERDIRYYTYTGDPVPYLKIFTFYLWAFALVSVKMCMKRVRAFLCWTDGGAKSKAYTHGTHRALLPGNGRTRGLESTE